MKGIKRTHRKAHLNLMEETTATNNKLVNSENCESHTKCNLSDRDLAVDFNSMSESLKLPPITFIISRPAHLFCGLKDKRIPISHWVGFVQPPHTRSHLQGQTTQSHLAKIDQNNTSLDPNKHELHNKSMEI